MTISLTPELDRFVERQVASGRYKSNSEVIRAGLRRLADDELRSWLEEGLTALEAGDKTEAGVVLKRLRRRLKEPAA